MNNKTIKEMRDKIVEDYKVPGYCLGQEPKLKFGIKAWIFALKIRLKIILNCIKLRHWKMAWILIKFEWRWRKYNNPYLKHIKKECKETNEEYFKKRYISELPKEK